VPPLPLHWEPRAEQEAQEIIARMNLSDDVDHRTLRERTLAIPEPPVWVADFIRAMERVVHVTGRQVWTRREIADLIERKARLHSAYGFQRRRGIPIMTIHGAKNRQFDHVVVLWPPGVVGEPDDLRRLLYNAVTRAELRCTIFVQSKDSLSAPPF
jgi:superfamily I DNA/RNA helicase